MPRVNSSGNNRGETERNGARPWTAFTPQDLSPPVAGALFLLSALATLGGLLWIVSEAKSLPGIGSLPRGGEAGAVTAIIVASLVTMIPALAASWLLPRVPSPTVTLLLVFAVGGVARVAMIPVEPGFSDDVYRYLWDGRVQNAGINPYGVPPADPSLDAVEDSWPLGERIRHRVNHPEIATVYPPFLELVFAVVARIGGGLAEWKLALLIGEMLLAMLLVRGLELLGRDPRLLLLYFWHPLPLLEVSWNAHAELIAVIPFVWCAILLTEERRALAGLAWASAVAAKILPVGFGLVLLRRGGVAALFVAAAVMVWLVLPFVGSTDPERAVAGLREYSASWYFNDLIYRPLGFLLGLDPENRFSSGAQMLRWALGGLWVVVLLWTSGRAPIFAACTLAGSFALLSPTVHPWYLLWVLPFACLLEARAWWVLAGTTIIAYEVWIGEWIAGVWIPWDGTRLLVYGVPLALMAWNLLREWQENRRTSQLLRRAEPASPGGPSESR